MIYCIMSYLVIQCHSNANKAWELVVEAHEEDIEESESLVHFRRCVLVDWRWHSLALVRQGAEKRRGCSS